MRRDEQNTGDGSMSKEFLERLATGGLTDTNQYRRMKDALSEIQDEDEKDTTDNGQEWKNWDLSPVGSNLDAKVKPAADSSSAGIEADSVHRAMEIIDRR